LKGKFGPVKKDERAVKRWSYSSWSLLNECALRFKSRYIDKQPEAPSEAMARGTDVHTKAEYWLQGKLKGPVPKALSKLEKEFNALRQMKPRIEQWYGVNQDWSVANYNSWCVGKVDADVLDGDTLVIIDHKTGRIYADKHKEQASLYAALGAAHFPKVKSIELEFWYLDQGDVLTWKWDQAGARALQPLWGARGDAVMNAEARGEFEPTPGQYCRWCKLSKANGGNCKAG
jgi:hypothetical protein